MAEWFTADEGAPLERLESAWGDAPTANLELLGMILEVAREQVEVYAFSEADDVPAEGTPPPTRLVFAQLQQAKNLWNAGRVSSAGEVGMDSFTFTPRPLDKTIRGIIRPKGETTVA